MPTQTVNLNVLNRIFGITGVERPPKQNCEFNKSELENRKNENRKVVKLIK